MMNTKYLLYAGSSIPIVFWITTIICGFIQGDYNHFTRMVSELGTIGTKSQYIFTTGLVLCSALSIGFVIGLFRACKVLGISFIPAFIILSFSLSIVGAGIFPLPLRMHQIMGMPSILLIFSPLISLFFWNRKGQPSNFRLMAIFSLVIMSLGFLVYMPAVLTSYLGLKQRFFHIGWSVWFVYLSYSFVGLLEKENIKNSKYADRH
jgi:hypothetical membrane protein